MTCTWDPSNVGSNITLSGGDLTWTSTSASYSSGRATLGYLAGTSGGSPANLFLYFEVTATFATYPTYLPGIGICNQGMAFTSFAGNDDNGVGYYSNSHVAFEDTDFVDYATYNDGAVIGVAVDFLHEKIWWTLDGSTWNDDTITNQNPATNTGGFSSAAAVFANSFYNTVYPAFGNGATGSSMTGNFSGPFAYTVPSGFSAWAPSALSVQIDWGAPLEASAASKIDAITPIETSGTARLDEIAPAEWAASIRRDASIPGEILGLPEITINGPIEWTASVDQILSTTAIPLEWQAAMVQTTPGPIEASGTVVLTGITPIETAASARVDTAAAVEGVASARRDAATATEFLGLLEITVNGPIEWTASVYQMVSTTAIPLEWQATMVQTAPGPIEASGTVVLTGITPVETAVSVRWDMAAAVEHLASAVRTAAAATETLALASVTENEPIESIGTLDQIVSTASVPIEWVVSAQATASLPSDVIACLAASCVLPIESYATYVYPFTIAARVSPMTRVTPVQRANMSLPIPVRIRDPLRAGTVDTRGLDLSPALLPISDTVLSISGIAVTRVDGAAIAAGDLTIPPIGYAPPWISANAAGLPAMQINWYGGAGATIAANGDVEYVCTVSFTTAAGRPLAYDFRWLVSAALG